jgi:hypothetical protein
MSTGTWTRIWVKAPPGNGYTTPQAMARVGDHIASRGAWFRTEPGPHRTIRLPIQEPDGTWEIRWRSDEGTQFSQELREQQAQANLTIAYIVKGILTRHYGLEIVRENVGVGKPDDLL